MFLLTIFVSYLHVDCYCHYLGMFTVNLDFLSEDIIQDKSNSVHGLFYVKEVFLLDVLLMTVSSRYLAAPFQWR